MIQPLVTAGIGLWGNIASVVTRGFLGPPVKPYRNINLTGRNDTAIQVTGRNDTGKQLTGE